MLLLFPIFGSAEGGFSDAQCGNTASRRKVFEALSQAASYLGSGIVRAAEECCGDCCECGEREHPGEGSARVTVPSTPPSCWRMRLALVAGAICWRVRPR